MANHGPLCKRIKNDKEINHMEETVNVKWWVSKVPEYSNVAILRLHMIRVEWHRLVKQIPFGIT